MAQDNPFLKSPFDDIGTDDSGLLPGQQAVRPALKATKQEAKPVDVDAPEAPAAPVRRAAPTKDDVIARAEAHGVDPALALSIWSQESGANFNTKDSPKGARGGMQVMPGTFRAMMGNADQRDPWNNLEAGLRYIAYGQKTLGTNDPMLLAAGYHAGYDRKDLKAGKIPNTSDGLIRTAQYAQAVASRAGGKAKVVSDSPDDMSRFVPLSEAEAATYAQSGDLDASRFVSLTDDEVKQFGAQTVANPFEAPKEQGFFGRVGDAVGEGMDSTMQSLGTARFVMGGGDSTQLARDLATKFSTQQAKPKTEGQKEIDAAFQRVTDAKGTWDTIKAGVGAVGTAILNPKDLAVEIAGQAPNMLPSLVGGAAGAGAGAAVGAGGALVAGQLGPQVAVPEEIVTVPVAAVGGAVWGGRAGMAAGTTATELGAEVEQMIQERLQASKAAPTEANIKALLDDDKFRSDARSRGLKKGLTVAAIDQIFLGLGGKVAGKAASAGTKAGKVALGAGAVATDAAGEVVGEAASQKVARGQVDAGDALREGVMGLGQSMVEPAVGAGMRAAKGAANAARPAPAAPAPRVEPTMEAPPESPAPAPAPAAAPAAPSGPLSGSLEAVAEQDAGEAARVTVTAPSGEQASGTVLESQEDGEGNFVTQIMGDDGQVYTFSSEDGVQITPEATPDAGPLSASLTAAAEEHDAQAPTTEPTPAEAPAEAAPADEQSETQRNTLYSEQPPPAEQPAIEPAMAAPDQPAEAPVEAAAPQVEEAAPPAAPKPIEQQLAEMDEPALRERLKYIANQAKASGGWNKMFMDARKAVEREIAKRQAGQPPVVETATEVPNVGNGNSLTGDPVDIGSAGPATAGAVAESRADGAAAAGPAADAQQALTGNPLQDSPASWVIREKATGKAVLETFDRKNVDAIDTEQYEAVPAYQHLTEVNDPESLAGKAARATPAPAKKKQEPRRKKDVGAPAAVAPEVAPAPAAAKKPAKRPSKKAAVERARQLADHFTPGNVVKGYAGHDRVLEYAPNEDGSFTVKVQHVVREGNQWVVAPGVDGRERTHSTMPNDRELKAGPVERAPAVVDVQADAAAPEAAAPAAPKKKREPRRKADAAAKPAAPGPRFSVTPEQAAAIDMETKVPADPLFSEAVSNTPGASVGPEGLRMTVVRYQREEQEGAQSVRTGVFYLPAGSAAAKHYKTGKNGYGGVEKFEDETVLRAPLFVKGATGGKAPEAAYDAIKGKKAYEAMRSDVLRSALGYGKTTQQKIQAVEEVLDQYGADSRLAADIVRNSTAGNTLAYAVQENIVAHAVRAAGYDSVVGYSKGKAGAAISEVFDVRETTYPARGMESEIHPDFPMGHYSIGEDGLPQAEFGPVHTEYRDDPAGAVDRLLADKDGEAIVDVPGLGDVSLIYGDEKTGLGHIARRRGAEFMERLPALLKDGTLYSKPGQKDRVFLGNDRDEAVVRFEWDGQAKTWLLSAYEKYPDGVKLAGPVQQQSRRSETVAERTGAAGDTLTAKSLRRALNKGALGPVIDSMVEAGVVVLHDGPGTLPRSLGKKVKGVQAVTMPDGTVHMVASNLSAANARAVMLHEAFHQGGEKLIGSEKWSQMMGRLGSLYRQSEQSNGRAKAVFDRARERVASAKAAGAVATRMEVEEFGAYAIEEYERAPDSLPAAVRKWVEDIIGLVKAWALKRYGRQLGALTPAQLSAMAKWAIMDVAAARRGEIFGPIGEMFSAVGEPDSVSAFNESMEAKYPGLRFDLMEKRNGDLHLSRIVVPMDRREQGTGSKFMEDLAAFADQTGRRVVLTASADFGGTAGRLVKFYKRFGFVENKGKNKDFSTMEGMYRDPAEGARFSVAAGTSSTAAATTPPAEPPSYAPPEQGLLRRVQAAIQDNQNRLKQVQDRILEVSGRTTLGKADHYGAETNRPGRIAARLEDARDHLTGPLMERLAKSGYTPKQLSELLHAQHAEERNAAVAKINPDMPDGGSGMTNDEAQAILTNYATATELHEMAKQARAIAKATLDLKLAYGLIKPEDHELLGSMYENYVPLKGDGEYGPKIKRAMGHEEREEHILENIARDYDQAVVVGEKNLARQSLLRMVLQFPDEALWTARVPPRGRYVAGRSFSVERNGKSEAVFTSQAQVAAFLEAKGMEATQYTVLDSAGERVVEFTKPLQDNEVLVYVNGDPVRLQIMDEALARQLRPLDQARMNPILEFMRGMNRWLSKVYTGYNPAFILRNAARDAMTGTINMMGNQGTAVAAKAWTKYPKAAATLAVWAKTKKAPDTKFGRYLTEYRMHGGKVGASYMSDLEEQGATLQEMYDNARGLAATARDGDVKRTTTVAWNKTVGRLAHVIEVINQATENALRLSLFIALREEGLSPGKAAQAAKTVTVDFDRKGTQTGALGAIYLFFNPAIQGVSNGFKTLAKGDHKKQAWAALGGLALAGAFAASAGMGDDPDRWLGESFETRTKNFMLNVGGYQFRAPLSQEFAPAYALGVALTEAMHGEDKMKTAVRIVSSFIDAYFPLQGAFKPDSDNPLGDLQLAATPTLFKPIAEAAMNRNSFGSQVVPENEMTKDRPDNLKMNRGTKGTPYDAAAQGIASFGEMMGAGKYENDLTKVSPETIKSLWRNYTGGLGTFITDVIGVASITASAPGEVERTEVPIIKDFVKAKDVKAIRGRYYDLAREAREAITEFEQAKKAGDAEAMGKIAGDADKARLIGLGRMVRSTTKAAAALGDAKVDINSQENMPIEVRRAKLKEIEKAEEELYRAAISAFK